MGRAPKEPNPGVRTATVPDSPGDPRVLFAMNLALSTAFAAALLWGLSLATTVPFTLQGVAGLALVLALLTYLVVVR